jgi:hypothetical protein
MSQVPQETLAALGTQMVAELGVGLRRSRSRSGTDGSRLPVAKPPHPVAKSRKAAAKQTRKLAIKPAKGGPQRQPAPPLAEAAPSPPSLLTCEPCEVSEMRSVLKTTVQQLVMLPEPDSNECLALAGRLLQIFCATCVTQNDLLSVQRLVRFARSLVAEVPAWKEQCEAAVEASQHAVWERFHTSISLTNS